MIGIHYTITIYLYYCNIFSIPNFISFSIEKKNKVRIEIQQNPSIPIEELKKAIIEKILK